MVKGLYTAYTGMLNQAQRMEVLTNNLANASTTGFKKEGSTSQTFDDVLAIKVKDSSDFNLPKKMGYVNLGVKIGETYTDYTQGSFRITDNTYDVALDGDGFFAISYTNKAGKSSIKYTRDGAFSITKEGYLVTKDGDFVLNKEAALASNNAMVNGIPAGAIRVDTMAEVSIDEAGVLYQNGEQVATLGFVDIDDYNYISKYGENLYDIVPGGNVIDSDAKVVQGALEQSNVNIVSEMVEMIAITRSYEANQKIIQTIDQTLDKAVNSVGQV